MVEGDEYVSYELETKVRSIELMRARFADLLEGIEPPLGTHQLRIFFVALALPLRKPDTPLLDIDQRVDRLRDQFGSVLIDALPKGRGNMHWMRINGGRGVDAGSEGSGSLYLPFVEYYYAPSSGERPQGVRYYYLDRAVVCWHLFTDACYSPKWLWSLVLDAMPVTQELFKRVGDPATQVATALIVKGPSPLTIRVLTFPNPSEYGLEYPRNELILGKPPYESTFDADRVDEMIHAMRSQLQKNYGKPGTRPPLDTI